ncbi:hypothetical protein [Terrisporobacter muris]|uniref:Uncharacterized protein n=1 Tax=Terrisporobacter muris TaxID=2963284 RepID=A0A9X2MDM0_9FIRM|nr:hypothetical protein [Terrisporobacter muris]MCR1823900.1 hypothetical protein [Terrisporobacter muris]
MSNNYKVTISRTDLYSKKYENVSIESNDITRNMVIKKSLLEVLINMISK